MVLTSFSMHSLLGGRGLLSFMGDSVCPHVSVSEASTERSPCFYRWCFEAQGSWPAGQHPKRLASVSSVQREVQQVQECDPCHLPGGRTWVSVLSCLGSEPPTRVEVQALTWVSFLPASVFLPAGKIPSSCRLTWRCTLNQKV